MFGSRARGDYTAYSDYDVLVVVSHSEERFIDRPLKYLKYSEEPLELFIYTTSEVEAVFDDANALILDALRDGVVLYDKGFWRELRGKFLVLLEKGGYKAHGGGLGGFRQATKRGFKRSVEELREK